MARLRYIAIHAQDPDGLADFYARHLGFDEVARSNQGDVTLTDGSFNFTFLKPRPELNEPDRTLGLHHVGVEVEDLDRVIARYLDRNPRGEVIEEPGGPHFGEVRIYDPECRPVSLSSTDFGLPKEERRIPRLAHVAFNALDPTSVLEFYASLFGVRELGTSFERREQGRKNRFGGDGYVNLAIHPFYNGAAEGHEARFGVNHVGFLVSDVADKVAAFTREVPVAERPATRPYAEYRLRDPENNAFDLSQKKGWEVDIDTWENAA